MFIIHQTESADIQTHTLWAFQKSADKKLDKLQKSSEMEDEEEKEEKNLILCKNCRNPITSAENVMVIKGRHRHTFSNPHGIIFEIACFSSAHGCVDGGFPTAEFTWFAGFSWRFSFCSRCHIHLGWQYLSRSGEHFYGLIVDTLIEGTTK